MNDYWNDSDSSVTTVTPLVSSLLSRVVVVPLLVQPQTYPPMPILTYMMVLVGPDLLGVGPWSLGLWLYQIWCNPIPSTLCQSPNLKLGMSESPNVPLGSEK